MSAVSPRFTPAEKARLMRSWMDAHAPRGSHGVLISDATDPALQDQWVVEPVTDFAQRTVNVTQKRWRDEQGDVIDMDALLWRVRQRPDS